MHTVEQLFQELPYIAVHSTLINTMKDLSEALHRFPAKGFVDSSSSND